MTIQVNRDENLEETMAIIRNYVSFDERMIIKCCGLAWRK